MHTTWRVGDIIGRIAVLDPLKLGDAEVPRESAGNLLSAALAASCVRAGHEAEQLEAVVEKARTTLHVVRCASSQTSTSSAIFAIEDGKVQVVVSITGSRETEDQVLAISAAIRSTR